MPGSTVADQGFGGRKVAGVAERRAGGCSYNLLAGLQEHGPPPGAVEAPVPPRPQHVPRGGAAAFVRCAGRCRRGGQRHRRLRAARAMESRVRRTSCGRRFGSGHPVAPPGEGRLVAPPRVGGGGRFVAPPGGATAEPEPECPSVAPEPACAGDSACSGHPRPITQLQLARDAAAIPCLRPAIPVSPYRGPPPHGEERQRLAAEAGADWRYAAARACAGEGAPSLMIRRDHPARAWLERTRHGVSARPARRCDELAERPRGMRRAITEDDVMARDPIPAMPPADACRPGKPLGDLTEDIPAKPTRIPFVLLSHPSEAPAEYHRDWTCHEDWDTEQMLRDQRNNWIREQLKRGETVWYKSSGNSLWPLIQSGDAITISPIAQGEGIQVGDIVAADVSRGPNLYFYVHMVLEIRVDVLASRMQKEGVMMHLIGNAEGRINGSASRAHVYGKVTSVQHVLDSGVGLPLYTERTGHLSRQSLREAAARANRNRHSAYPDRQW